MIKKLLLPLLLFCCICTSQSLRAQYIAIPDSNFGKWIFANGDSTCLTGSATTGWRLDTTCTLLSQVVDIDCSGDSIADLTGIRYFPNLRNLYCGRNVLTSLPVLPPSVTYISCGFNLITTIASLPDSLLTLDCSYNPLSSLPALPATVTEVSASHDMLASLPALPVSLQILICADNSLTTLPALPASLLSMDCSYNTLASLPTLPPMLFNLACNNNSIGTMPALDDSLRFLNCGNNSLALLPAIPPLLITLDCSYNSLPALPAPDSFMTTLYCEYNLLTILPALPDTMSALDCSHNLLSALPQLPYSLSSLDCSVNAALSCLPVIYQDPMSRFYIDSTAIQCLPDRFSATYFDMDPDSIPLCTSASGCAYTSTTGIAVINTDSYTQLYPNPNTGSFHLLVPAGAGTAYTITDIVGHMVAQETVSMADQQVDISGAAPGVYFLCMKDKTPIRFAVMR
jgi:Leucine-rich repeat (LRR) protein